MSERQPGIPGTPPPAGGDQRRLDRAPGERYGAGTGGGAPTGGSGAGSEGRGSSPGSRGSSPGSRGASSGSRGSRAIIAAAAVADVGALLFFAIGQVDLGVGMLPVAAFTGWATALALVWWGRDSIAAARRRVAIGAVLGGWSVAGGIILDWAYGLAQGGVLGPLDYADQRYGMVAPLALVLAAGVAALRAR